LYTGTEKESDPGSCGLQRPRKGFFIGHGSQGRLKDWRIFWRQSKNKNKYVGEVIKLPYKHKIKI
jgi:hypothetical protein